jgi:t-SNARE complex subunit (syntaxin)
VCYCNVQAKGIQGVVGSQITAIDSLNASMQIATGDVCDKTSKIAVHRKEGRIGWGIYVVILIEILVFIFLVYFGLS